MFNEHDVITLLEDVSEGEYEAKAGAIGTIVDMYPDAFLVEFTYGDVYRGDLITVRPHQARLSRQEDFRREWRERVKRAQAEGRTHGFLEYNSITLTEDVFEDDIPVRAGSIGVVKEVYADAILVEFEIGAKHERDTVVIHPHQARLATPEDFEHVRCEKAPAAQPVAD